MANNFQIIRETKVNTPESLLTMKPGTTVSVAAMEFSSYNTVQAAISRLNQRAERVEFKVTSPDNGTTLEITRYAN